MKAFKVGFIALTKASWATPEIENLRKAALASLKTLPYEIVDGNGLTTTAAEASALCTDLRKQDVSAVVVFMATFPVGAIIPVIAKELPVPVIAAIHGVAMGGGFQIAMGADIRFCTPDTKFSIMEMRWGLIPDMSVTQTIRDIVSIDVAKELIYTNKVILGEEALKLKLVTHVCEKPHEDAMALAKEIASKNPDAIRAAKNRSIRRS